MIRRAKYQLIKFVVPVCLAAFATRGIVSVAAQEQSEMRCRIICYLSSKEIIVNRHARYSVSFLEIAAQSSHASGPVTSCGLSLQTGFLTPLASILAGLGIACVALSWLPAPTPNLFEDKVAIILAIIIAAAISILGPGAFSLDARLFGRREIIIPPMAPKS